MSKRSVFFFTTIILLLGSSVMALGGEIRVNGGGAAINTVFKPLAPYTEKAAGITLNIIQSSPKRGLIELVQGRADIATAAHSLESMIKGAGQDGVNIDPATLRQTVIAKNKTVVITHKDNPVKKLSKEQLKGIFTGKITNWKDVGGKDMPVIVVWGKASPGQNALFTKEMLDSESVAKDILDATDYANIRDTVAGMPESIGINPLGIADASVNIPETPDVISPIIVVTKVDPSPEIQKLLDFIKGDGQKYIKQ
ncbi:MAG: substrate-binding domain-containing protein [Nitrospirae bacterium]|nr:substrate-binding domain-containing protein [Nitrospirota bacterium]